MADNLRNTYFIRTFGCQMNEHDSGKMANLLDSLGYKRASSLEDADIVLFNTCTIREKAYHKAESEIGRAGLFKTKRNALIGVCGCVAQQEGSSLKSRFEHIDFVFGPDQLASLPKLIEQSKAGIFVSSLDFIEDPNHPDFPHNISEGEIKGGSAFVAISKGCNGKCSYCIVPAVRGPEVSRPSDEVVAEIKSLVSRGAREVTLLGQNVNSYGSRRSSFAELIRRIAAETDVERIRFTSPHPKDVDDTLIEAYRDVKELCPHIHLPVQAGSNSVLKTMRRGYTRERFLEIVDELRNERQGMSVTTDMIVGFCGESAEDFEQTIDLMKRVEFESMFAFCYSTRPGTHAASELNDDVPNKEKKQRLERLLDLQRSIQLRKNQEQVGRIKNVLTIKEDGRGGGRLTGRAEDNRLVHFTGNERLIGDIVSVRIVRASMHSLQGEMIEN